MEKLERKQEPCIKAKEKAGQEEEALVLNFLKPPVVNLLQKILWMG